MIKRISLIFTLLFSICASAYAQDLPEPALIPLWPNDKADNGATLQLYQPPADKSSKTAIIVCPGGGYAHLAKHEGHDVGLWLQSIGVTAIVLKYRRGEQYGHPIPLNDAQRAIRTVRANADKWQIDPARIGIMGFSAGGHLAASASTHFDDGNPNATEPVDKLSSRPDFSILGYPVITMTLPYTHKGSRKNLLGNNPDDKLVDLMSNEKQVTAKTPPTFIFHSVDDKVVPLENALLYVEALRKANAPFEFHVYESGNHGYGLAKNNPKINTWPTLLENWLRSRGFLK